MEKGTRDLYLVHQHAAEAEIHKLTDELKHMGTVMTQFGTELMQHPEQVLFSHAPVGLGEIPPELAGAPAFDWDELPDRVVVARQLKALRRALTRLAMVRRQL